MSYKAALYKLFIHSVR